MEPRARGQERTTVDKVNATIGDAHVVNVWREGSTVKVDTGYGHGLVHGEDGAKPVHNVIGTVCLDYDSEGDALLAEKVVRSWSRGDDVVTIHSSTDNETVSLTNQRTGQRV